MKLKGYKQGFGFKQGYTLVEMLVAMTLTLILVIAIAEFMAYVGNFVRDGRAMIELNGQMRVATSRLKTDLESVTVPVQPWNDEGAAMGYFEIVEGPAHDYDGTDTMSGDSDDVLAFTIPGAEVVWFAREGFLYRRELAIRPGLLGEFPDYASAEAALLAWWQDNNVSASIRQEGNVFRVRGNTIQDLCLREHRYAHQVTFPHTLMLAAEHARLEDRIAANVLAFDVRVFDERAPIRADNFDGGFRTADPSDDATGTLLPSDPGWQAAVAGDYEVIGFGAYVDLHYNRYAAGSSLFSGPPGFYDTWAKSYERDGIDQNGNGILDEGTDGLDNDQNGIVDDERETSPPYPYPLRGVQIGIRLLEPGTRQVRHATVGTDFLRE